MDHKEQLACVVNGAKKRGEKSFYFGKEVQKLLLGWCFSRTNFQVR